LGIAVHGPLHAEEPVYFADVSLKAAVEINPGVSNQTLTYLHA
jgi:hypothetical protein